jgi:hypothetical protein
MNEKNSYETNNAIQIGITINAVKNERRIGKSSPKLFSGLNEGSVSAFWM